MKNIIFLVGFMGTGKTTVAAEFSKISNYKVIDLDQEIERTSGMAVSHIFKTYGEDKFRDMETQAIRSLSQKDQLVVACGGGVILRQENVDMMKRMGWICLLTAEPEIILTRVKENTDRPLLNKHMNLEHITKLLKGRELIYQKASDITIRTDDLSPVQIADEIRERLKME